MTAPILTGFSTSVTFAENTVNAAPQLIDSDVTLTSSSTDFDGGTLSLTGLVAEDTVSVRNQGTNTGEIGLSGSSVTYAGTTIGTLAGGIAGSDLVITFNDAATAASIEALIENLTYANSSDTPTTSRDLQLDITGAAQDATFDTTALTGAANPFNGIDIGSFSSPSFVDLDGDGDLDLVVGERDGILNTYLNGTNGASGDFEALTGAANPFNGIDIGSFSTPSFVDLDGDGDLDLVVGGQYGILNTYRNGTNGASGDFEALTGAANPFNGINVGNYSNPSFVDLDGDGDLDLVVGESDGILNTYRNGTNGASGDFEALTGAANPFNGIDVGFDSSPSFVDLDGDGDLDLVVGVQDGTLETYRNGTNGASGDFEALTGAANPFNGIDVGNYSNPSFVDLDGDGDLDLVVGESDGILNTYENITPVESVSFTLEVTAEIETPPIPTDFSTSVTFAENTVNAAPQLIDSDVTLTSSSTDFDGGTLSLTGLVAEDTVSVRNQGTNTGEIGLSGSSVTYAGTTIGTLAGGIAGSDLVITFNDAATAASIEALIENLTYANSSDTPTTSRDLQLNITGAAQDATFDTTALTGAANPFNGINVGYYSNPSFVDLDGDGDLDLVVGESDGTLNTYRNGTNGASGDFEALTGAANPFNGIDVGNYSNPSFVDLDGDGDLDLVVGESDGTLNTYRNGTNGASGDFEALTGAANPLDGIDVGEESTPSFVDLDGDGDLDLVVGVQDGTLETYRNGTNGASGDFEALTGVANPFNGIDVGVESTPSFVDLDGDGDLDLVVGEGLGTLETYRNGKNGASGDFEALTGAANPFNGIDVGYYSHPSFVDLDGDGDLDLVVGESDGILNTYENITPVESVSFTLEVTAEIDYGANVVSEGSFDLSGLNNSYNLTLSGSGDYYGYGNGNDNSIIGNSGANTIKTYGGNDKVYGGKGNDKIDLGSGNDYVRAGGGVESFIGGSGTDYISYYDSAGGVTVNLATNQMSGSWAVNDTISGFESISGSKTGADTITGTSGANTIKTYGGNDKVYGGKGNDKIDLGSGNDYVRAGGGVESFIGGSGTDYISYYDSAGGVTVNLATNQMSGSWAVNDTISGFESISGSKTGADTITGTSGANTIKTYGGNDKVYGGKGNDKIDLGSGNDYVRAGGGVESFIGGSGTDYISYYDSTGGVTVNLAMNQMSGSWAGNDTISGFESISGSKTGADTITGTSGANTIKTYGGNDKVYGGKGNDKIDLGSGNDYVKAGGGVESFIGGSGTDYISYYDSTGGVTVNLATNQMSGSWAGNDTISGFESISGSKTGADTITGTSGANTIKTYGGNDKVYGGKGNDKIDLGSGNDYVKAGGGVESFIGGSGTDYISYYDSTGGVTVNLATNQMSGSWAGNDTISGFESISGSKSGADTITGTSGANTIKTYGGNDKVYGGKGKDSIEGGSGQDYMYAGNDSDRDVFIFRDIDETVTGSQRDRIYQFDSGEDDIDLSFIDANEDSAGDQSFKFSSNGAAANSVWAQDSGSNVLVRGDVNGDTIHDFEIYVASVDDLYAYDFIL